MKKREFHQNFHFHVVSITCNVYLFAVYITSTHSKVSYHISYISLTNESYKLLAGDIPLLVNVSQCHEPEKNKEVGDD